MPNTLKLKKTSQKRMHVPDQDYQEALVEEAHYNAQQHEFIPGFEEEEWLETENEVVAMLKLY